MMTQDERTRLVLLAGLARGLQSLYDTDDREQIIRICAFCERLLTLTADTVACRSEYRAAQGNLARRSDAELVDIIRCHILTTDSTLRL